MKKNISILFLIIAIVVAGCKKKPAPVVIVPDIQKNHLQRNHIYGTVKNLDTQTFYLQKDSIPLSDTSNLKALVEKRTPEISSNQNYTSDGYLLRYVRLNSLKDTVLIRNYTYGADALIESWEEMDSNHVISTSGKYIYDRNRFLSEEQIFKDDSLVMSFKYSTDGIGNIIATTQSFGNFRTKTETKYNQNGLVSQIVEYEPNGKVFKTAKIEYDNYGDEVNRCVYKAGNQMIEYTYNKYDQRGRQIQTIYEDRIHDVKEYHYYFNYDKENNWTVEVCAVDDIIVYVKHRNIMYYNY